MMSSPTKVPTASAPEKTTTTTSGDSPPPELHATTAAHTLASAPVHAAPTRMSLEHYDRAMAKQEGDPSTTLLDEGWDEHRKKGATVDKETWQKARQAEMQKFLGSIDYERFHDDPKLSQSAQMMLGRVRGGDAMLMPPDPEKLDPKSYLFRGSTIDSKTGEPYVGSGGSAKGTPTTPSPVVAALFALKGATENKSDGVVIHGPVENVAAKHGFAAPDVMSGQEQEVTVNANPSTTNASLGGASTLANFKRVLKVVGRPIPDKLDTGSGFDQLVIREGQRPLTSAQDTKMRAILADPKQLAQWEALEAQAQQHRSKQQDVLAHIERKKKSHDTADASAKLTAAKAPDLQLHTKLEDAQAALDAHRDAVAAADGAIKGAKPLVKENEPAAEEDDFDLFAND